MYCIAGSLVKESSSMESGFLLRKDVLLLCMGNSRLLIPTTLDWRRANMAGTWPTVIRAAIVYKRNLEGFGSLVEVLRMEIFNRCRNSPRKLSKRAGSTKSPPPRRGAQSPEVQFVRV